MKKERPRNQWNKELETLETLSRELAADRISASFELVDTPYRRIIVPAHLIKSDVPARQIKPDDEEFGSENNKEYREFLESTKGDSSDPVAKLYKEEETLKSQKTKVVRKSRPFRRCVHVFHPAAMDRVKENAKSGG